MFKRRAGYDDYLDNLAGLSLFAGVGRRELGGLATLTTYLLLRPQSELCRQGATAQEAFVILSGFVSVSADGAVVARLSRGATLGVRELNTGSPRAVTAMADGEVEVLVLNRPELRSLLAQSATVATQLLGDPGTTGVRTLRQPPPGRRFDGCHLISSATRSTPARST